jgi:glycosyltransferase involved in cell wall biosynthesis
LTKRLKIAHFTQFLGIGGLEKIILELASKQKLFGHEVVIIVYDHEQEWVEFFRERGLKVETSFTKKVGLDLPLARKFSNYIQKEDFDIVHTHDINPLMYLGLAKIYHRLIHGKSIKLIHTAHTLDHVENSKKVEIFERFFAHLANQIIAVSSKISQFYLKRVMIPSDRVQLIENGISVQSLSPQDLKVKKDELFTQYQLSEKKLLAICLSRIVPLKDQIFLAKSLSDRDDLQLIIVGPSGDQKYYNKLKEIVEKCPKSNIRLLGPRSDVLELNSISDIYLSASTHEGLPVSVLEAMSVETPCLVSNIEGHKILNKYGDVVETYQIGDSNDFTIKLNKIIKNKGSIKYKKAKKIVSEYFSTDRMVKRYIEVYLK